MKHCSVKAKVFSWTILWKWYLMLKVSYRISLEIWLITQMVQWNISTACTVVTAYKVAKYALKAYEWASRVKHLTRHNIGHLGGGPKSIQRHCQHEKFVTTFWMFGKNAGNFRYSVWIDIVDIGLLTINSYRVLPVNFVDIIVFAIVCIVVVVSICQRLCVVILETLLWTRYWYMH